MSRRQHQSERESSAAAKPARKRESAPRHDRPGASLGNEGVRSLVEDAGTGKALPAGLRARLERSFGIPLHSVVVRDDAEAREAARTLGAEAFASGDQICLGPDAPSIESREAEPLLAHEITHVAQQRRASHIEDAVSTPGDAFEQNAAYAGAQAAAGVHAAAKAGGSVPAVQRQPAGRGQRQSSGATRAEVEQALLGFLQRVLARTPSADLRRTRVVRNALDTLVRGGGSAALFVDVDDFLKGVPNEPAEFARRFSQRLPQSIDRSALDALNRLATADSPEGTLSRVGDLVSRSKAGGPETGENTERTGPAAEAEKSAQIMRRLRGEDEPKTIGPAKVDVLQLGRILRGLPGAINPPAPRNVQPEAQGYAQVEVAIAQIPQDALTPAEARGAAQAGSFADAREFARDLARQIDVAQQQRRDTVSIRLADNYNQVRDRQTMRAAVENIIGQVRAALPHHGSNVVNVDVYFGAKLVTRGRARASE